VTDDRERHERFGHALGVIRSAWSRSAADAGAPSLPTPEPGLPGRCWVAVNSPASARIAGATGFNMLFSHLRTPDQYRQYVAAYREAGGRGRVAANRPVFVGPDDATAWASVEPALRRLWRRFEREGKIPDGTAEPDRPADLASHPINFVVGGPESVARQLRELHEQVPFDVANVEVRWDGLPHDLVLDSLRRLMIDAVPLIEAARS